MVAIIKEYFYRKNAKSKYEYLTCFVKTSSAHLEHEASVTFVQSI